MIYFFTLHLPPHCKHAITFTPPFFYKHTRIIMAPQNTEKLKELANKRHTEIYNKLLDNIEYLLDGFSREIVNSEYELTEVPKTAIATLDFLVSSIVKIQKGHRTALGLDNPNEVAEPEISIIQGIDPQKV